jgi:hypothetical protein
MATTYTSKLVTIKDTLFQALPVNVNKVPNTINNLVRVLELMLTLSIPPTPTHILATIIPLKVTTLGGGLD